MPWIDTLCQVCGAAEWVSGGVCLQCAIKANVKERTEDRMDIIERAEQWLASIDKNALFDSEGAEPLKAGPELVRALVEALKIATQNSMALAHFLEIAEAEADAVVNSGINDAWPGDPGAAD